MRSVTHLVASAALVAAIAVGLRAQGPGRTNANWPTVGADAQRTSWMKNELKLSAAAMASASAKATADTEARFQFLWKTKLDNRPVQLNALTQPLLLQNIISHKGFKALAFVGGSADVVYAIDYELNRLYWKQRLSTAARPATGPVACPGGLTAITRAVTVTPPGLPGGPGGPGPGGPAGRGPGQPGPSPNRGGINTNNLPINSAVYALSSGGMVHFLNPHIGEDIQPPVKFLPPNAKVAGLIAIDNVLYAATADHCGGAANGIWALDLGSQATTITKWESNGGSVVGTTGATFGLDGTVYAATGAAPKAAAALGTPGAGGTGTGLAAPKLGSVVASEGGFSNSVVALEPKSLKLRDYFTSQTAFTTAPVVFRFKDRDLLAAANSDGRVYVLDAKAIGGADHKAPLARSAAYSALPETASQALATWEEPNGTRWLLAPSRTGIVAFKVVDQNGALSLEQGWASRDIASPLPPTILNDIVFAVASGLPPGDATTPVAERAKRATPAVLYALDGRTGKELWTSGSAITSFSPGIAPAAGDSQVYVVTYDGTVYAFGLPQER